MQLDDYYGTVYNGYEKFKLTYFQKNLEWLKDLISDKNEVFSIEKLLHHKDVFNYFTNETSNQISVFIVGEGNYGKSTLLNALVQGTIAEVDFLPKTWVIQRYIYGTPKTVVYYQDGSSAEKSFSDAKNILKEEERHFSANRHHKCSIKQIDWYYDSFPNLKMMNLVDTPGLAQLRSILSLDSIEDYYYKSDCVLWLFNSSSINSESTLQALESVKRFSRKIIGVINKWDMIAEKERDRILETAKSTFGTYLIDIIPVSSKLALHSTNTENYEKSNFPNLLNSIKGAFLTHSLMTRNVQTYLTARVALIDGRKILTNEVEVANDNMYLFQSNLTRVRSKLALLSTYISNIEAEYNAFYESMYSSIRSRVTPVSAESVVNELTGSKNIDRHIDEIMFYAKRTRDADYYELVNTIGSESYRDVIYLKDGNILSTESLHNLANVPDPIRFKNFTISITVSPTWFSKLRHSVMSFLGGFINAAKNYNDAKNKELQDEIIKEIKSQAGKNWKEISIHISENYNGCYHQLNSAIVEQFNFHFTDEFSLRKEIRNTTKLRDTSIIPFYFLAYLVLSKMRSKHNAK